jgi:hypothetical protein
MLTTHKPLILLGLVNFARKMVVSFAGTGGQDRSENASGVTGCFFASNKSQFKADLIKA